MTSAGIGGVLGLGLLVAPTVTPAWAAPRPVEPKVRTVTVALPGDMPKAVASTPSLRAEAGASVASLGRTGGALVQSDELSAKAEKLSTFSLVGATLPSGDMSASDVEVRVRTSGKWGGWQTLSDDDSAPDADTTEGRNARKNVTAPLWVGPSDGVQVRVKVGAKAAANVAGKGVEVTLVDPGTSPADNQIKPMASADAASGQPNIIRRSHWGADERLTCSETTASDSVSAAVVHHTAGSNNYRNLAEAMRQIRGDYAYHTKTRGWCDLGYNFIVDKWGNVYEGRRGSVDNARVGAHAAGFNKMTVGITMLGNYSSVTPSFATKRSVANVIAWKLSSAGRSPGSNVNYIPGDGSPRYPKGKQVTVPRVLGHRNVGYTTCPGNAGYAQLSWIRNRANTVAWAGDWVRAAYADTVGRQAPESAVITYQNEAAANGRHAMVAKLAAWDESRRREVRAAYQLALRRDPTAAELSNGSARMGKGLSRQELIISLLASPEFYKQAGSNRAGYVNTLFIRTLERGPSRTELLQWAAASAKSRSHVARQVYRSTEGRQRMVDRYAQELIGRKANAAESTAWAGYAINNGDAGARRAVMMTGDYFTKANRNY